MTDAEWERNCETPNSWEQIAYWVTVCFAALCTLALACGVTGYVWLRWGDEIAKIFN